MYGKRYCEEMLIDHNEWNPAVYSAIPRSSRSEGDDTDKFYDEKELNEK